MPGLDLLILAGVALAFAVTSRRNGNPIAPAVVATVIGLAVGTAGLGWFEPGADASIVRFVGHVVLAILLFSQAAQTRWSALIAHRLLPLRLTVLGLAAFIILGTFVAAVAFWELSWWHAVILALVLAPTDPSVVQPAITMRGVADRVRTALATEGGLGTGIVLVLLLLCLTAAAPATVEDNAGQSVVWPAVGALAAALVGLGAGLSVSLAARLGWMDADMERIAVLAATALCYGAAEMGGGNGLVGAFCGGLAYSLANRRATGQRPFSDADSRALAVVVFVVFGAILVPAVIDRITAAMAVFAILMLTVVRVAAVAAGLFGAVRDYSVILFVGWFGARGVPSILLVLLMLEGSALAGAETAVATATLTILISVVVHGLSAYPLAVWFGAARRAAEADAKEIRNAEPHGGEK